MSSDPLFRILNNLKIPAGKAWQTVCTKLSVEFNVDIIILPLRLSVKLEISTSCSCRRGETVSLNCGHQLAYLSSSRSYISMESHCRILKVEG
jgi:hypothetical protein